MPKRRPLARLDLRARISNPDAQPDKEAEVVLREPKFVGEVPVLNRLEGHPEEGKVIGTARLEQMSDGDIMVCIDGSTLTGEMLRRGFSLGSFSIKAD